MSGRGRGSLRALAWWLPLMSVLVLLAAAEALVNHGLVLAAVIVLAPVCAFALGRWQRPRRPVDLDALIAQLEARRSAQPAARQETAHE